MNPMEHKKAYSEGMLKAQEYFEQEQLELPYIPSDEKSKIQSIQENVFSSKPLITSLYDIEPFVGEFLSGETKDYVALGFAGHGVESRAIHYYAVKGNLGLFLQLQYGTPGGEQAIRDRIDGLFYAIKMLFKSMGNASNNPLVDKDKRLLVIESDFYGKGWGWIEGHPETVNGSGWHQDGPVLLSAINDIPQ